MVILAIILIVFIVLFFISKYEINNQSSQSRYYRKKRRSDYFSAEEAGAHGEYQVYTELRIFERCGAKFLFNLYIPKPNGETTEIDLLMLSPKGIFVIESKNYSGWIFGDEKQTYWYQLLPIKKRRTRKETFYNPIMQNRSHIKHLKKLIEKQIPIYSVITFSDKCTFKNLSITSKDVCVIHYCQLYNVIANIHNQTHNDSLSDPQIDELYAKLYPYTQVDKEQKEAHINNIHNHLNHNQIQNTQYPEENNQVNNIAYTADSFHNPPVKPSYTAPSYTHPTATNNSPKAEKHNTNTDSDKSKDFICPKCGDKLVLRTTKNGNNIGHQFLGCSNYPHCTYIRNLKKEK